MPSVFELNRGFPYRLGPREIAGHWAKISKIVFGARIADAEQAGFSELTISNEHMKTLGHNSVEIVGDFLRDECVGLFKAWAEREDKQLY